MDNQVAMVTLLQHSNNISSTAPSSVSDSAAAGGALSRAGHTAAAVVLGFILVLGFLSNFLVLLVFSRFHWLRTPAKLLLINISASDMFVCIFGTPISFAASVRGGWLTGSYGCRWYGFSNALFGIVSLVSLSLLSFERYSVVLRSAQFDSLQSLRARVAVAASWLYSLVWTVPPLLGWGSYGPEGHGTTCSVQWHQRSATSRSYVSCLFVFCLILPLLLMLFCYGRILLAVRVVAREVTEIDRSSAEQREGRILLMVVSMVTGYLLCWMPYGVVAMLSSFGRPGVLPPTASLIPSLLAKASTVLNPVIYVLLNKQFSRCFLYIFRCSSEAPPTQGHLTLPSSGGAWSHPLNLPTEEQYTLAAQRSHSVPPRCSLSMQDRGQM
ncbi:pinopsin-like isoform X3 [Scophthalmus maximus]|nr:pinopsin-like isoform X3 [Scophthalmus maximus]XP_047185636.1 pinopsin-like isoform X3 [Scophthalmus maximus]XP_047185641.1 pinopsin-like isoform X3 [Scophthalmus maximus]XP_047185645.1 pinopsin-like isoform X3 [Scophthalmus maximus]